MSCDEGKTGYCPLCEHAGEMFQFIEDHDLEVRRVQEIEDRDDEEMPWEVLPNTGPIGVGRTLHEAYIDYRARAEVAP